MISRSVKPATEPVEHPFEALVPEVVRLNPRAVHPKPEWSNDAHRVGQRGPELMATDFIGGSHPLRRTGRGQRGLVAGIVDYKPGYSFAIPRCRSVVARGYQL